MINDAIFWLAIGMLGSVLLTLGDAVVEGLLLEREVGAIAKIGLVAALGFTVALFVVIVGGAMR